MRGAPCTGGCALTGCQGWCSRPRGPPSRWLMAWALGRTPALAHPEPAEYVGCPPPQHPLAGIQSPEPRAPFKPCYRQCAGSHPDASRDLLACALPIASSCLISTTQRQDVMISGGLSRLNDRITAPHQRPSWNFPAFRSYALFRNMWSMLPIDGSMSYQISQSRRSMSLIYSA